MSPCARRKRRTNWLTLAGWPIPSRSASQPFVTAVPAFNNAASRTFSGADFLANLSNLQDEPAINEIAGPNTPAVARIQTYQKWGSLWTFGLKSSF